MHRSRVCNRELQTLNAEREKQRQGLANLTSTIQSAELSLSNSRHALKERQTWEHRKDEALKALERLDEELKVC